MITAIILAGGTGSRIGADIPKQFIKIMGKPILAYSLEVFQNNQNIDAIEIVCHRDWMEETKAICRDYAITKFRYLTEGGETFQDSVMNGIYNLRDVLADEDMVVVSFGVSPLTTDEIIDDNIRVCREFGNAIAAEDEILCSCIKDDELGSTQPILRETLKGFANPWAFRFGEVYEAYKTAEERDILKDLEPHTTSLYFALGKKLYFSKTTSTNIKITTKEDLDIFEGYLLLQEKRKRKGEMK